MEKHELIKDTLKTWVEDWAQVQSGEKVLIVSDPRTDKFVLDTVTALARERGAKVTVCEDVEAAYVPSGSHVDEKFRPMSEPFYAAWKAADLVLTLGGGKRSSQPLLRDFNDQVPHPIHSTGPGGL